MWTKFILIIYVVSSVKGQLDCCLDDNVVFLSTRMCSNNDSVTLECDEMIHLVPNASLFENYNYKMMGNGKLIDTSLNEERRYCQTYNGDDDSEFRNYIYIICIPKEDTDFEDSTVEVVAILEYVSIVFIVLTIIVYIMVPKLLDMQGVCIMHALVGMAVAYTFLGIIQLMPDLEPGPCEHLAFITYFSFLYMMFWMDILCFHIWRVSIKPRFSTFTKKWMLIYHTFGIGGPVIFLIFLLSAHHSTSTIWDNIKPGIGEGICWFKSFRETMIFLYGPFSVLLSFNVIFYLWTVIALWKQMDNTRNKILKYRVKFCIRLFFIMGITWIFEVITAVSKSSRMSLSSKILFFILDLFNMLQGLLIFLILVVFRKRVRKALARRNLCNIKFPNSWKYLEDEEMESAEEKINCTVVEYKDNDESIKM